MRKVSQKQALERLNHLIARIDLLKDTHAKSGEFKKWRSDVKKIVRNFFGEESNQLEDFQNLRFSHSSGSVSFRTEAERKSENAFRDDLEDAREFLYSLVEDLNEHLEPEIE
jgi:hypothetical protein